MATIRLFLRELRGAWPGADPPLDDRAAAAARHLGLTGARAGLTGLAGLAAASGLDVRDLESGLVRLELSHRRAMARCPRRPGLHGAAVAEAGMSVASPACAHGRAGQKVPATRDCSLSPA